MQISTDLFGPVFNMETLDTAELLSIVGHEREVERTDMRRNAEGFMLLGGPPLPAPPQALAANTAPKSHISVRVTPPCTRRKTPSMPTMD